MPAQAVAGHDGSKAAFELADRPGLLLGRDHSLTAGSDSDVRICKGPPQDAAESDNAGPATSFVNKISRVVLVINAMQLTTRSVS